jgi:TonB family protein
VGLTVLSVQTSDGQQSLSKPPSARLPDGFSVTMPSIASRVMPTLTAAPAAITGDVDVETVVSATGTVAHTRVAKSADPSGALDRSCVDALRQWRFGPAMNNGRPMASLVLVRFSVAQPAGNPSPVVDATLRTVEYSRPPEVWTPPAGQASPVAPALSSGVKWPSILREIQPSYTPAAMRAKVQGAVEIDLTVGADGTVVAARITKGLDAEHGLDTAALTAARYWLFSPGTKDGVPVPTRVGLVLEFRLH